MTDSTRTEHDGVTLASLEKEAASLLRGIRKGEPEALARFYAFADSAEPALPDALHVVARERGFDTWARLKRRMESA
ncbi:MAG: hypothetical protein JNM66_15815 [Bryobacterales bacterium]|nr:hypothetical protein [Bryobacterales bacterium]